jgi:PAS domain S-box-containing protein
LRLTGTICLGLALAIVSVTFFFSYRDRQASNIASRQVRQTGQALETTIGLLSSVKDAESAQRGFLLTGNPSYLEPYRSASATIGRELHRLDQATSGTPEQEARAKKRRAVIVERFTEMDETIQLRKDEGLESALVLARTKHGKSDMNAIDYLGAEIELEFTRLEASAAKSEAGRQRRQALTATGSAILFVLVLAAVVALVFRDVTARRNAELAHESLASIVESFDDAIIGNRLDGVITSWNDAATRIFGYSADEMIGNNIAALIPCGRAHEHRTILDRIRRGERVLHYETVRRRKDGQEIAVDLTVSSIRNAAGLVVGAAKIARDISERKRSEAAMQRMQEQLVYSQKLESLSVLAGGVAHDFNNLLMGIIANATLMLDEAPPESKMAGLVDNVLDATEQAAHLTRQMLAYSGKGRFAIEALSLNRQVRAIASLIQCSVPKGVDLNLDLAGDMPRIGADSGQIQQLATNLILNAVEAIEQEGTVTISTYHEEVTETGGEWLGGAPLPPGGYVVLQVKDTGCGMDEATRARMFDPFFTTKFTGRGLGLAAALGIVRGHKGAISVLSEPGRGTTFRVYFPTAGELAGAASYKADAPGARTRRE